MRESTKVLEVLRFEVEIVSVITRMQIDTRDSSRSKVNLLKLWLGTKEDSLLMMAPGKKPEAPVLVLFLNILNFSGSSLRFLQFSSLIINLINL